MSPRNVSPTLAQNNAIYRHHARRSRGVTVLRDRVRYLELLFELSSTLGSSLIEHGDTLHDLMDRADQAMYASKHAGRNRLTVAGG